MLETKKILLADDDDQAQKVLGSILERYGFEVILCGDAFEAKRELDQNRVDLIVSDYVMPEMDGLELLRNIRREGRDTPFILMTGYGSVDSTVEAISLGTVDYLAKPFDPKEIILAVQKVFKMEKVTTESSLLQEKIQVEYSFENLVGQSPSMQAAYRNIHKASQGMSNVLITGETGTGKELAARAIHYNGLQCKGPFIAFNCSAFSEGTLESELFGHVKGAFTDAHRDHKGRFELAHGGTLFLDEAADIPLSIQVKLLRVLQEKTFERVGGQETLRSDFRLIAATNKDPKDLVKKGLFREDLFYRLSVINIIMPPLREHPEDITILIKHFLQHYNRANKKKVRTLSLEAMKLMQNYSWPGNVRQLENAMESAVVMCDGKMIGVQDLPLELRELTSETLSDPISDQGSLPEVVARTEARMIQKALDQNAWVKARAARELGISERVLSYKIDKYGIRFGRL